MAPRVRSLRKLAATAQEADLMDIAELALRRIVEIDPRDENGSTNLGFFLEKQGELDELEALLPRAREALPAPPLMLLRSTGRKRLAAGQAGAAVEVLREARAAMPAGGYDWIDAELRQAYAAVGREVPPPSAAGAQAPRGEASTELGQDTFCMMFYAHALMDGEQVERDLDSGIEWLTRSAEAGNWWAIGDLGHLWDEGWYGLERDEDRARAWKQLRARLGDAEARGWLVQHGYPPQ